MRYCINPKCENPENPNNDELFCHNCGSELLIEGQYLVLKKIGSGGFGNAYEVEKDGKLKVLKVLHKNSKTYIELFKQEAKVLEKLHNPGIPRVEPGGYFTYTPRGNNEALHCLVMEKIGGQNLEKYLLNRGRPINQTLALKWLKELVKILDDVQRQGFFHRDIKPGNIMLQPNGKLGLIDFGIVKEVTVQLIETELEEAKDTIAYTPYFSAPEQAKKGGTVPQSDFFALGRTFVYLMTGKHPNRLFNNNIYALDWQKVAPHISPQLGKLINDMMMPSPEDRPASPEVILDRLANIEQALSEQPTLPKKVIEKTKKPLGSVKHFQKKLLVAGAIFLIGFTGIILTIKFLPKKLENKLISLVSFALVAGLGSQAYGYFRYGYFPSNPRFLLANFSSSNHLQKTLTDYSHWVGAVVLNPNGETLASSFGNRIKIWHLAAGITILNLTGHYLDIWALAISQDGEILASAAEEIKIWNLAEGKEIGTIKGHSELICALVITPDQETLISGSIDSTIKVWNLETKEKIRTLRGHGGAVNALAISPDGRNIASGGDDGTVRVWNLATGLLVSTFTGHSGAVNSVAFSPDGLTLASGAMEIKIWNLELEEELLTLPSDADEVNCVVFSPDRQSLVSGNAAGKITIWNLISQEPMLTLIGHCDGISSLSMSLDGQILASGSYDKTIKVWRLE
ncbi:MAG: serine/threonine protein kinase [Gomphosphaeria aponina SAG 52.96 = DSM 107014]|uniref:Serine/threonine protein kinase n=1 Tax=Gomphosphaeria aponina SAG 52.96 = DSM 107014 TaxID=1521640 RepID=A0A941GRE9_9CHRO|nr:serine/threonine protein kinase [Gomphosphaeria aponina SAG 52.96 = DSM 107014]